MIHTEPCKHIDHPLPLSQNATARVSTMADLASLPKDWILTSSQFTRKAHTNVYPAIHPGKADNSLKGKTVVVTGASRGIGARGIAPAFVEAGVKAIVLIATNPAKLVNVEEELKMINPDLETLSLSVDVSSRDQVAKAWLGIKARYHRVDILVNNAGVESTDSDKTHEQDPDIFFRNFVCLHQQYLATSQGWIILPQYTFGTMNSSWANTKRPTLGSQCQRHPYHDTTVSESRGFVGHDR